MTLYMLLLFILLSGCSTRQLAVRATTGILVDGMAVFYEEGDLGLAESAIGANLKLVEALLRNDPANEKLLLAAAEGYTSYAIGFIEDESPARASRFYLRARDFGLAILLKNQAFAAAFKGDFGQFQASLTSFRKSEVPALFWTAMAWINYINLNRTNVQAIAEMAKVQTLVERVLALDETFYFGGPHLVLGTILSSRSRILGGNPEKAREHFESCLRINQNKFLLSQYFYAQSYAVQVQDLELFRSLLQQILTAPEDLLPEQRLANAIARKKAQTLLDQENDKFLMSDETE